MIHFKPLQYRKVVAAVAAAAALFIASVSAPQPAAADELSWSTLDRLRTTLETRSPLTASFTQVLVPAGFALEDVEPESGQLAMDLPVCLRWDYFGDFEKSFLLCEDTGYYWNPGETVGQIFELEDREDAPGLDFFLRTSKDLRSRYKASSTFKDGQVVIDLIPIEPTDDVTSLQIKVDAETGLLENLSYDDVEGNRTIFEIGDYKTGATTTFQAPDGITWERP